MEKVTNAIQSDAYSKEPSYHDAIARFLETNQQEYSVTTFKSRSTFIYVKAASGEGVRLQIHIKPWLDEFTFHAYAQKSIAPAYRADLLHSFAVVNAGERPIKVEINPETGCIRCGYAMLLCKEFVDAARLAEMERRCLVMMDTLLPTVLSLSESD